MPVYRTKGVLTGHIAPENVAAAQRYMTHAHDDEPLDMASYLYDGLEGRVEMLEWHLDGDGHSWTCTAFTLTELTAEELEKLASQVSGQNSDGHGENFEQQDFAWETGASCGECDNCELGWGDDCSEEGGRMISFDWETNDCKFERVK